MMLFFFFFSSRRRHTRFDCDWSSDVCSSDLTRYWKTSLIITQADLTGILGIDPAGTTPPGQDRRLTVPRSEEHTSELQSQSNLVCRLLLEKKNIHYTLSLQVQVCYAAVA